MLGAHLQQWQLASTVQLPTTQRRSEIGAKVAHFVTAMIAHFPLMQCWLLLRLMPRNRTRISFHAMYLVSCIILSLFIHAFNNSSDPPLDLCVSIFPWVEEELVALKQRQELLGKVATDVTLSEFLSLLQRLRLVILQDAAVLSKKYPSCALFSYPPFNTSQFSEFASGAAAIIQQAEDDSREQLSALPEAMAASLRGIVTNSHIQQVQTRDELRQENIRLCNKLNSVDTLLRTFCMGSGIKRRRAVTTLTSAGKHLVIHAKYFLNYQCQ